MQVDKFVSCEKFPCTDVKHECYIVPDVDLNPDEISIVMISEAAPENSDDYYYAQGDSLFQPDYIASVQRCWCGC